jgi:adenylylsulfate kinase-like enzyme
MIDIDNEHISISKRKRVEKARRVSHALQLLRKEGVIQD